VATQPVPKAYARQHEDSILKMKKSHLLVLFVLIITAIVGTSFPHVKRAVEIRSETRKWNEKWPDRAEVALAEEFPSLAKSSKVPESIDQDQTLSLASSPWVIDSHVTIREGVALTIEPGVEIFIAPKADIQVYGRILASGTPGLPIRLRAYSDNAADSWAGLFFRSDTPSEFRHVDFDNSSYGARLVFASVDWEYCRFKNVREICSGYRSSLSFDTCLFDYREFSGGGNINVMKFYQGDLQIENSEFFTPDSDYKVDGIDADYVDHAIIRGNRFFGGQCENSDAIDIGHGSRNIVIENNLIAGFIDKGISVGEKAVALINNNVIANCAIGVGVKDSARATITKTTFYKNGYAVKSYEKVPGKGGGYVKMSNSLIALSQNAPVEADSLSTLEVSTTLCDSQLLPGKNNSQGTAEFKDIAQYDFNVTSILPASREQAPSSPGTYGAKL
jgi:hypothetical protein